MPSLHGLVLALLVIPGERADDGSFRRVVDDLILLAEQKGHAPVPEQGPAFGWQGVELEAHVVAPCRHSVLHPRAVPRLFGPRFTS